MKIASLVPSATEILFALGLGENVVAVTHECDFPPEAGDRPHLTRSVIRDGLEAGEIDAEVRRLTAEGKALYELDRALLKELEVDLIVTQAVCQVCAVDYADVIAVAASLPSQPEVISLDPATLGEVLDDVVLTAEAAGEPERGKELRHDLELRLEAIRASVAGTHRARIACLEWLDPPFTAGHWIPEMVRLAGGIEVLGTGGAKSLEVEWEAITAKNPDRVVAMPCGWDLERSIAEAEAHRDSILGTGAEQIDAVDAAASFSRPGPRLVDGVELLAHLFHPDRAPDPGTIPFSRLT